ncbi:MAG: CoB--CoM heterodisulfide reductase subunit B [Promethearchaeota archaeon]|nr:MAG: CoB--CoM heterodisulfide reductase subunit B [Candidatus Lokiarchaeota archaeon]
MAEYKLFSGCVIPNRLPFLELASRKVFDKLGVQTSDAPFSCCPDPVGFQSTDKESWLALGARNLCITEGKDIVSLCNGCTQTLKAVQHELKDAPKLEKEKVDAILSKVGKEYKDSITVKHFVQVLMEDAGIDKIKSLITKPIELKVACHTGCHYARPPEVMQWDDPDNPIYLRQLVEACGATPVDYEEETLCCGSGVSNAFDDYGLAVLKKKLDSALAAGADCLVVVCPACFQQFDTQQRVLSKNIEDKDYKLPVLYLTELMALGMGEDPKDLNLKFHGVKTKDLLAKIGL